MEERHLWQLCDCYYAAVEKRVWASDIFSHFKNHESLQRLCIQYHSCTRHFTLKQSNLNKAKKAKYMLRGRGHENSSELGFLLKAQVPFGITSPDQQHWDKAVVLKSLGDTINKGNGKVLKKSGLASVFFSGVSKSLEYDRPGCQPWKKQTISQQLPQATYYSKLEEFKVFSIHLTLVLGIRGTQNSTTRTAVCWRGLWNTHTT